ncbi:uncharacterized protein [Triticum aestivum]|uniref:uncharacterized protein isoform X3 n=1 Tax=Triticum aestivum TaxID=4565 RepID=UPI001D01E4DB|nr:uncharacterized protein LOC123188514 isoform X3 [Triticum aestivum]
MSGSSALRMLQGRVFLLGKKVVVAKKGKGKKKGKDSEKATEGPEKQKRKRAPNKKSVEEAKLGGPVHYRWMYPLERSFVWLKSLVRNRTYPEGSIAEGYIVEECLTFCLRFLEGTTRFTRTSRNPDPSDNTKGMYMFDSVGEPIGKAVTVGQLDDQLLVQAHRYVLRHCDELDDLRREFVDQEKRKPGNLNLTDDDNQDLISRHFADWLEQKAILDDGPDITEKIRALAAKPSKCGVRYSGYIINGF